MNDLLLSIQDLSVAFKNNGKLFKAVNHVSLDLKKGDSLGIVGESGSGKTLTALSVLKLLPPAANLLEGKIHFLQREGSLIDIIQQSDKILREIRGNNISIIFQEPMNSLNPVHKCGEQVVENILEHQFLKKHEAKALTLELFTEVKLPSPERIFNSFPYELSGGQRQRVMIAMALSNNPDLLIADEPTTALDVTVQKSILTLLNQLKDKYGMSLIFISHDLGVVSEVADHIAVMHNGKIIEKNEAAEIFQNPQHDYTKGLLACRPSIDKKINRLLTLNDFIESAGGRNEDTGKIKDKGGTEQRNSNPLVQLREVSKYYPLKRNFFGKISESFQALKDINLQISEGEVLGVVGESGSGKSTLGRVLLGLLPKEKGQIVYNGKSMDTFGKQDFVEFRKKAQIIFQDPYSSLNPRQSVGKIISEPLEFYRYYSTKKECKKRTFELLENVKLGEDYYNRYPHELSGGQRQRVAIARVLGVKPELIICDEVVSALDVSVQAEILNLLKELKDRYNLSYLFISHDFAVIRFMSDNIAVMKDGKIIENGSADQIFHTPVKHYTKSLLKSIPLSGFS
ncbi:MAG: ABC transporter ATP-binding protein [Bacteroidales bacterium]